MKNLSVRKGPTTIQLVGKEKYTFFIIKYRGKELKIPVKNLFGFNNLISTTARIVHQKQGLTNMFGEKVIVKEFEKK